jgi:hypothetical protein
MYIWPFVGDAISWPTMYAHSGSSKGPWNGETVISAKVLFGSAPAPESITWRTAGDGQKQSVYQCRNSVNLNQ